MRLGLYVSVILILFALLIMPSLSNSDSIPHVNSLEYDGDVSPGLSNPPSRTVGPQPLIENTQVEIVKSFKNSSGFFKINGTLENQGPVIHAYINVIKYYKIPSVNDTTLVCYEQKIVNCEYKSMEEDNNQLPPKSFFLLMPENDTNVRLPY